MIYYFFTFFLIFAGNFFEKFKTYFTFLFVYCLIFFCFGYMTGSDWRAYESIYNDKQFLNYTYFEPGFDYLYVFFQNLETPFFHFLILIKSICFSVYWFSLRKYNPGNFSLLISIFLSAFGLYYFIDNPLRNLIASTIIIFSLKYLISKDYLKFIFFVFIAFNFHATSLFALSLLFIHLNIKKYVWIFLYVSMIVVNLFFVDSTQNLLLSNEALSFLFGTKLSFYFELENDIEQNFFSIGSVFRLIIFVLVLLNEKEIKKFKYGKIYYNGGLMYLITNRLGAIFLILSRLQMFNAIFFCLILTILAIIFTKKYKTLFFTILLYVFIFLTVTIEITTTYRYIPYTNYLFYLDSNLDFFERSNYNFLNSPYR